MAYEVDWAYETQVFGTEVVDTTDKDQAEYLVIDKIRDENPDARNIEVQGMREI